jgi:hypothetical protein
VLPISRPLDELTVRIDAHLILAPIDVAVLVGW